MTCPDHAIVDREILHDTQRDEAKPSANHVPVVNRSLMSDGHRENWELEVVDREPFFFSNDLQHQRRTSNATAPRQPRSDPAVLETTRGGNGAVNAVRSETQPMPVDCHDVASVMKLTTMWPNQ